MAHDITKDVIGVKEFEVQDVNISGEGAKYHGVIIDDKDLVNKKYVVDADIAVLAAANTYTDNEITDLITEKLADHPHQDVTTTARPEFTSLTLSDTTNGNQLALSGGGVENAGFTMETAQAIDTAMKAVAANINENRWEICDGSLKFAHTTHNAEFEGIINTPNGAQAKPAYSFASNPDTGMYFDGSNIQFSHNNSNKLTVVGNGISVLDKCNMAGWWMMQGASGAGIGFGQSHIINWKDTNTNNGFLGDIGLARDSAGVLKVTDGSTGVGSLKTGDGDFDGDVTITENLRVSGTGDSSFVGNVGIGTTTPTLPLDVNAKSGMSVIGGICIKLTNKTGSNSVAGQLVKADATTNDAVSLAAAGNVDTIGVFLESGIADGAEAWVVVSGIADVALDDNVAAVRGYWMGAGVLAGYAATSISPPAAPTHFEEIGHCIESVAAGGAGTHILARCVLHFN